MTDSITVEFTRTIRVEQRLDLVAELRKLPEAKRAHYFALPLEGYSEWERPIAWAFDVLVDDTAFGDVEDEEAEVVATGRRGRFAWDEEDYDDLVDAVPWLAPLERLTPEDLARIPGPLDVPMFRVAS